jgi:Fe-S-cluster containining protein
LNRIGLNRGDLNGDDLNWSALMQPEQTRPQSAFRLFQQDAQLIQIVDAALADATRRAGPHLVCRPGCTQCCHGAFAITPLDALRLRTAMAEMAVTQPTQAADIAGRARQYLVEFGSSFPGDPNTGVLGTSPEAEAAFEDFANEAPCPALNPESGLCDVYAARPMTCRVFGPPVRMSDADTSAQEGFAVCELCFTQASPEEIAAAEMTVPHAEEQRLLQELQELEEQQFTGETIVAFCLVPDRHPS